MVKLALMHHALSGHAAAAAHARMPNQRSAAQQADCSSSLRHDRQVAHGAAAAASQCRRGKQQLSYADSSPDSAFSTPSTACCSSNQRVQYHNALCNRHVIAPAASSRDSGAAEQDLLSTSQQDAQQASPPQPPSGQSAAMPSPQPRRQQQPGQQQNERSGSTALDSASQQQAMTAALQQGLAMMQWNQNGSGARTGSTDGTGSTAGCTTAADRGVQAAADAIRQYGGRNGQRPDPAARSAHDEEQGADAPPDSQQPAAAFGPQLPAEPPLPRQQWPPKPNMFADTPRARQRKASVLQQDIGWYLAWRKRLPAPARRVEAALENAVVARPRLHDTLIWLGGTVGLAGKLVAPTWREAVNTTAAVLASIAALAAMVTAIDAFWMAAYRAYSRFGGMSGWRPLIASQLQSRLGLRAEHLTQARAWLAPYLQGAALALVVLLAAALAVWTWRTWVGQSTIGGDGSTSDAGNADVPGGG